jgi:uncharacterized surface protein with fasciclin (FAS1) repeats
LKVNTKSMSYLQIMTTNNMIIALFSDLLTYHVVPGTFYSGALSDGMEVATVQKSDVRISINGNTNQTISDSISLYFVY